jgi:hypothetical protein
LFRFLDTYYEEFRDVYDERFAKHYGFWRSVTDEVERKSLNLAIFLEEELFRSVPHRHWVWSVPKMLRLHFLHHRKLLPKPLELVCEPDADYIPWQDDAPEIEVG